MTAWRAFLLAMIAALLSSCAAKRAAVVLDTTVTSPDLLRALVEENNSKISSVVGNGIITFDSPELAGSAAFESNLKKPDSLLVTLEGPFGIDVGTFFLCKDTYVVYNSLENSVVTGSPHGAAIRSIIPFDLSYDEILSSFSGVFPVPQHNDELRDYRIEDDQFVLVYSCGPNTCTYMIDPRYLLVTLYEVRDEANNLLVRAQASSLTEQRGASLARRIRITFPAQSRQLSIAYNSVKLNPAETDFRFTIPANARRFVR